MFSIVFEKVHKSTKKIWDKKIYRTKKTQVTFFAAKIWKSAKKVVSLHAKLE